MDYRTTKMRYKGGGKVKYLVYRSPQPPRTGRTQQRTRVHRLYFPENATGIRVEGPQVMKKRTGRRVYAVMVHYRSSLSGATAHRKRTTYKIPSRRADRTKVIEVPRDAKSIRMTTKPPIGPKMAVA